MPGHIKVPALVMIAVVGLGLGAAAGVAVVIVYGQKVLPALPPRPLPPKIKATTADQMARLKKLEEDAAPPPAKANLAALVVKLDQLATPLTLTLDKKQQQAVLEQLKGLADLEMLPEDDAQAHLYSLRTILEPNHDVLEAAGILWGEERTVQERTRSSRNPFRIPEIRTHLQSVKDRFQ